MNRKKLFTDYKTNTETGLFVVLLRSCPYSKSLAKLLKNYPRVQKKWVQRGSASYLGYKEKYQSKTYPMVIVRTNDQELLLGGYSDFYGLDQNM